MEFWLIWNSKGKREFMLPVCSFSTERSVQKLSSVLKEASMTNLRLRRSVSDVDLAEDPIICGIFRSLRDTVPSPDSRKRSPGEQSCLNFVFQRTTIQRFHVSSLRKVIVADNQPFDSKVEDLRKKPRVVQSRGVKEKARLIQSLGLEEKARPIQNQELEEETRSIQSRGIERETHIQTD
ncbi:hypothetical protein F2Q70_00014871 [Brassica cretica]|uniref:Uncharacterized protein n=1 Tax=Brassica cretica TaxID=69181 RepID=A0A8S9HZ74_BRACR|nr:hypothetical protein F2Q70_00014871 [Brassica cretica]